MTPEQQEACAKRAYEIFAASSGEQASWSAVAQKHRWYDAVRDHHQQPGAIARKDQPTLQDRAINHAYREIYQPVAQPPLVVPPPEGGKQAKGK